MKVLAASERQLLQEGLEQLELPASAAQLDWYEEYVHELQVWGQRVRLISGSTRDIVVRHILDSLAPWRQLHRYLGSKNGGSRAGQNSRVEIADIGSGNGFPGLSLAGVFPGAYFYLVERSPKKAAFLRSTAGVLSLKERVQVEELDVREFGQRVPLLISRAFMPIAKAYPLLQPLLPPEGGLMIFYAGRRLTIDKQFEQMPKLKASTEVVPINVPFLEEQRHLCTIHCEHF